MDDQRKIEVFSAGCPACDETVQLVKSLACPSCDVEVLDMHDQNMANRAKNLGVRLVPAVVVDGKLADCSSRAKLHDAALKSEGVGQPICE